MKFVWLSLFLLAVTLHLSGVEPVSEISKYDVESNLGELVAEFGHNKCVPDDLVTSFYAALKYYPALKDVDIKVRFANIKTTMQCRPKWDFLLHSKSNRSYVIYVDSKIENHYGVLFEQLPFNAQVGVFGHELAHIIDYETKNNLDIVAFGINYLNHSKRKEIENKVDLIAIENGLGYQIENFSKYVFEDSGASIDYLRYKLKYYLRPFQIKDMIAMYPIYNKSDVLVD